MQALCCAIRHITPTNNHGGHMHSRTTSTSAETNAHPHARPGHSPRLGLATLTALCGLAAPALAQRTPGFTLVQPVGAGTPYTFATVRGIADDGSAVVGTVLTTTSADGCYWSTGTGFRAFTDPLIPQGTALSGNGARAYFTGASPFPRRYDPASNAFTPMPLSSGDIFAEVHAASHDGTWAAGATFISAGGGDPALSRPVRWNPTDQPLILPLPAGLDRGEALGVSDDGTRVVGNGVLGNGTSRSFVWNQGSGSSPLPTPAGSPSPASLVRGLSGDGRWAVGTAINAAGQQVMTRWDLIGGDVLVTPLPAGMTSVSGVSVSDDGSTMTGIGFFVSGIERGVVWTAQTGTVQAHEYFTSLGLAPPGEEFSSMNSLLVSGNGLSFGGLIGVRRPSGEVYGGIGVVTIPSPPALVMSMSMVALLGYRRRRAL